MFSTGAPFNDKVTFSPNTNKQTLYINERKCPTMAVHHNPPNPGNSLVSMH